MLRVLQTEFTNDNVATFDTVCNIKRSYQKSIFYWLQSGKYKIISILQEDLTMRQARCYCCCLEYL